MSLSVCFYVFASMLWRSWTLIVILQMIKWGNKKRKERKIGKFINKWTRSFNTDKLKVVPILRFKIGERPSILKQHEQKRKRYLGCKIESFQSTKIAFKPPLPTWIFQIGKFNFYVKEYHPGTKFHMEPWFRLHPPFWISEFSKCELKFKILI